MKKKFDPSWCALAVKNPKSKGKATKNEKKEVVAVAATEGDPN